MKQNYEECIEMFNRRNNNKKYSLNYFFNY